MGIMFQGQVINLKQQIRNFEKVTLPELEAQVGRRSGGGLLPNYLFIVGTGGNDYSFNYFLSKSNSNVSLQAFTANLTASLSQQLKVSLKKIVAQVPKGQGHDAMNYSFLVQSKLYFHC